ncbi:MAG: hypothetical protein PUK75_09730 [bacterium]|nr:hypothetical protein [bacterium]MDY4101129.1 hypothetical protein [Lachnospiraceae bacterium]
MIGGFQFRLNSNKLQYDFVVHRKITKVVGDSATGKSELVTTVAMKDDAAMNIHIVCKYEPVEISRAFSDILYKKLKKLREVSDAEMIRETLEEYDGYVFFCDETFSYLFTDEFAVFCKYTDSFFVICCRAKLTNLPYSHAEIYQMKTSGKYHTLERVYDEYLRFPDLDESSIALIEDSGSGFEFYSHTIKCNSAHGKSNLPILLKNMEENEKYSVIIADGAAIGSEIADIIAFKKNAVLFLPESFEYLLLASDLFGDLDIDDQLQHTENMLQD